MFPITHIWFAEKVLGRINSSVILGAIFPDIVITGCLEHKQTHCCGYELYDYLKWDCSDFARAMATHTVSPKGLDYYGDECYGTGYKGYCFQKGSMIVEDVIRACNLPEEFGLWKAHNFIEMGIELNMIDENSSLLSKLSNAFLDKAAVNHIAEPIERYFNLKPHTIEESFQRFSEFIQLSQTSSYALAVKYDMQMQSKHNIKIDVEQSSAIIQKCRSIVKDDIDEFMRYCSIKTAEVLEGGDYNKQP